MRKICGVYLIFCFKTQKYYIGYSADITNRWASHLHGISQRDKRKTNHGIVDDCIDKNLTEQDFFFQIVEIMPSTPEGSKEALRAEAKMIRKARSNNWNLYNRT